jgi:RNA polymerase sigma-70 factor (ECF subfamily)
LCAIARHKIVDSYRAGRLEEAARRELQLERFELLDEDIEEINELAASGNCPVRSALSALTEVERTAVIERVVLEREYAQIAERTGSSQATVRQRVSRGLARLRSEIGAELK